MMRVRIHRGTHEIGGTCVELEAAGTRLVLDIGWPLDADMNADLPLPAVPGLAKGDDPSLLGVVISHPHQDHWGFMPQVHEKVPVYIGEAAHRILSEAAFFSPAGCQMKPTGFLRDRQIFTVGPFTITPYLVDHSAFDSYALLVEAEGKRLFYSGDFRAHGRKKSLFAKFLKAPPKDIDVLLLEGTHIRPKTDTVSPIQTEADVEKQMIKTFCATKGMVLAAFSAQNIDRLVTVYRAAVQANRDLIVDLYTATIAKATGNDNIPQPGFKRLKVYVPQSQRVRVKNSGAFDRVNNIRQCRVFPEDLQAISGQAVMVFRSSLIREIEHAQCLEDAILVWSLWHGYLQDGSRSTKALHDFCKRNGVPLIEHHSSGHAGIDDLQRLVDALKSKSVVPVHTSSPDEFQRHFPNVDQRQDGVWWKIK